MFVKVIDTRPLALLSNSKLCVTEFICFGVIFKFLCHDINPWKCSLQLN